jgi:hypothetical protein
VSEAFAPVWNRVLPASAIRPLNKEKRADAKMAALEAHGIVAKQNEGPVSPIRLRFVEDFARYEPQDPNRPLFSNRLDKRQEKDAEVTALASVKEVFPNAKILSGDEAVNAGKATRLI